MHPFRCAAAVASVLLCLQGCSNADSRRTSHLARAHEFLTAGQPLKARLEFQNALQIKPSDVEVMLDLAGVDETLGDANSAGALYQSIIDLDRGNVRARARLGRLYMLTGALDRALELVQPALVQHPDDPDLLAVRGGVRVRTLDLPGALEDAERALRIAPRNENAIALRASLHQQQGQLPQAIALVEGAITQAPDSADLREILTSLYLAASQTDQAARSLRDLIRLKPDAMHYRYRLAQLYLDSKQVDDALGVLQDAVRAQPDSNEPKLEYAEIMARERGPKAAGQLLLGYLANDARNFDLRLALGELQQREGDVDGAIETFRALARAGWDNPQALQARNRIAALLIKRGIADDALRQIATVLRDNPHDNDALLLRADIELARDDPDAAIGDLRAVIHDKPKAVVVWRALANAETQSGNDALAEESLRQALELAPEDTAVRIELANVLTRARRAPEALTLLEQASRLQPRDGRVREVLIRAYLEQSDLDAAQRAADQLTALMPTHGTGPYLAGLTAQAQGRVADAYAALERALALQPDAADTLAALCRLDVSQAQPRRAIDRLQARLRVAPDDPAMRNLLGEMYSVAKQPASAIEQFRLAIKAEPRWWPPYKSLAGLQLAGGDAAAAIHTYESGVTATAAAPDLVISLGSLYEQKGRIEEAIRLYQDLHQRRPRLDAASNNLAMLLVTYRTDPASLGLARDLTSRFIATGNPTLLDTQGWVLFKRGEVQQALPALEQAARDQPKNVVIRYHLGMAQSNLGLNDQARMNLEAALAGDKPFTGSDEARATLARLTPPATPAEVKPATPAGRRRGAATRGA